MKQLARFEIDKGSFRYAADCALAGIIFVMPIVMGGRHPLGRLIYIGLVTALTAFTIGEATVSKKSWRTSGVEWLLLLGLVAIFFQIIRLPAEALASISPFQTELLPAFSSVLSESLGVSAWNQISFTPHATWLGMGMFIAHASLFLVLVDRFKDLDQIKRMLHWLAFAALGMALFGLLQYVSGTEKFSWIFEHYSRPANIDVTGPFVNSNHFAHFLALGIGPLVWWLLGFNQQVEAGPTGNTFRGKKTNDSLFTLAAGAALALVSLAGLLAKSRGGMLVMFLGMLIAVVLYVRLRMLTTKAWYVLGGMTLVVVAGLGIHGYDQVQKEVTSMTAGSLESMDQSGARRKIWTANLEVAKHFPILGAGVGSHEEIYQRFFPHYSIVKYTHAESSYLHLLTETGVIGFSLTAMGILYLLYWLRCGLRAKSRDIAAYSVAIAAGVGVSLAHSVFDFPWYIPSCMAIAIIMAAAACGLAQHAKALTATATTAAAGKETTRTKSRRSDRTTDGKAAVPWFGWAAILLLAVSVQSHVGPAIAAKDWIRYHKSSLNSKSVVLDLTQAAGNVEETNRLNNILFNTSRRLVSHLERVLKHDSNHPHAHARMAALCIELFNYSQIQSENAMSLDMIRDAAISSNFESREALDSWLANAVGPSRRMLDMAAYHSARAIQTCPLQGRSYLQLGKVAFLKNLPADTISELDTAALAVRPHDGAVLFTIGAQAALRGDVETALSYYRDSFRLSRDHRSAIISTLAGNMPAPFFVNHFEPDEDNLEMLFTFYRKVGQIDKAQMVAPLVLKNLAARAQSRSGIPAGTVWHRARDICRYLGNVDNSLMCAHKAVAAAPNWYQGRIALAEELMARENFAEAYPEYVWCKRRRPRDKQVAQRLAVIEALYAKQQFQQQQQVGYQSQALGQANRFGSSNSYTTPNGTASQSGYSQFASPRTSQPTSVNNTPYDAPTTQNDYPSTNASPLNSNRGIIASPDQTLQLR